MAGRRRCRSLHRHGSRSSLRDRLDRPGSRRRWNEQRLEGDRTRRWSRANFGCRCRCGAFVVGHGHRSCRRFRNSLSLGGFGRGCRCVGRAIGRSVRATLAAIAPVASRRGCDGVRRARHHLRSPRQQGSPRRRPAVPGRHRQMHVRQDRPAPLEPSRQRLRLRPSVHGIRPDRAHRDRHGGGGGPPSRASPASVDSTPAGTMPGCVSTKALTVSSTAPSAATGVTRASRSVRSPRPPTRSAASAFSAFAPVLAACFIPLRPLRPLGPLGARSALFACGQTGFAAGCFLGTIPATAPDHRGHPVARHRALPAGLHRFDRRVSRHGHRGHRGHRAPPRSARSPLPSVGVAGVAMGAATGFVAGADVPPPNRLDNQPEESAAGCRCGRYGRGRRCREDRGRRLRHRDRCRCLGQDALDDRFLLRSRLLAAGDAGFPRSPLRSSCSWPAGSPGADRRGAAARAGSSASRGSCSEPAAR